MLAYGISAVSADVGTVAALETEVVRAQVYRLLQVERLLFKKLLKNIGPRIGGMITRKSDLKVAVPVAGVAILFWLELCFYKGHC
jgi:hypothetical protein